MIPSDIFYAVYLFSYFESEFRDSTQNNTTQTQIQRMSRELPDARGVAGWVKGERAKQKSAVTKQAGDVQGGTGNAVDGTHSGGCQVGARLLRGITL